MVRHHRLAAENPAMCSQAEVTQPVKVLLVDDGKVEEVLFRAIVEGSPSLDLVHVARDGVEAMAFLRREVPHQNARLPDLILLDIHMPRKDGFEVLREIRADPALRRVPVIMLTASSRKEEINRAYEEGANTFLTKPADFRGLEETITRFVGYWAETAQLPSNS
jgi:CheY-like chemotaxis protein